VRLRSALFSSIRLNGCTAAQTLTELAIQSVSDGRRLFAHLQLGAVFERRDGEGGAHRVCRLSAIEPEAGRELAHYAVDGIRIHRAAFVLAFAVGTQRPE
jgi:hypothetical protein